ncbi:MAG: hypothetical protein HQM12_20425 [SAR324 cluster bacterium]|nr:hypothetical protein [SAR324 cluster bacterium]
MENIQRINVKLYTETAEKTKLEPLLDIFQTWKEQDSQWLDLADYLHMPYGPGVVLFGTVRIFSFDLTDNKPGILYAHRSGLEGTLSEKLKSVLKQSWEYSKKLADDSKFPASISKNVQQFQLMINDRTQMPVSVAHQQALQQALISALTELLGHEKFQLSPLTETARACGFEIQLGNPLQLH